MVFIAGEGYTLTPLRRQDGYRSFLSCRFLLGRAVSFADTYELLGVRDEDREGRIRVGKDYQVSPPDFIPLESKFGRWVCLEDTLEKCCPSRF
jgi:hypothetical protein